MSKSELKHISLKQFLSFFLDENKSEKRFCFILGSGASKQSGIPTGGELAKKWMEEIEKAYDIKELEQLTEWKKERGISESNLAEHYTEIYEKRFEIDPSLGYVELERLMETIEPSCGYSVLSQVLTDTKHNVVITTNFDSLTEDALFIYTQKKPIVCGHESLASFARPMWQRPLIIKVHRDVLFGPKSSHGETESMDAKWTDKLNNIFQNFSPIVIGYGGNDGSLMGLLEKIEKIPGIYWCYRKDSEPNDRIKTLIGKQEGRFIPIDGFDEMMIQLNDALGYGFLDDRLADVAKKRVANYRKQYDEINKRAKSVETEEALKNIVPKTKRNWWHVQMDVNSEKDITKKRLIYEKGLKEFPGSYELMSNCANFFKDELKENNEAEKYYKKSLELKPDYVTNLINYALFLTQIHKKYSEAEKYYKRSLELEPNNVVCLGNYAIFLFEANKNYDEAEKYFEKALELDPNYAINIGNYAIFLADIRKNYIESGKYFVKALELDPNYPDFSSNYAQVLLWEGKNDKAEEYIDKAFSLNPENQSLLAELWFYRYAHYAKYYEIGKQELEKLIKAGAKSEGWNLKPNIEIAKKDRHPSIETLERFAKEITGL